MLDRDAKPRDALHLIKGMKKGNVACIGPALIGHGANGRGHAEYSKVGRWADKRCRLTGKANAGMQATQRRLVGVKRGRKVSKGEDV